MIQRHRSSGAAALLLGAALLLSRACSSPPPGREAYLESGCPRCHGADLSGTGQGPALRNLRAHWDRERLNAFLEAPDRFRRRSERLEQIARRYSTPMPAFVMGDSTRRRIAAYLLDRGR